jgi:hypothetical protein
MTIIREVKLFRSPQLVEYWSFQKLIDCIRLRFSFICLLCAMQRAKLICVWPENDESNMQFG